MARNLGVRLCGILIATALGATTAEAAPFSVESPGYASRETAEKERKEAVAAGAPEERTRIVRRYERGAGWRYLVTVEEIDDEKLVATLSMVLGKSDAGVRVIDLATGEAAEKPPPPSAPATTATSPTEADKDGHTGTTRRGKREAEGLLRLAIDAHGGAAGGLALLDKAQNVTFQFDREVEVEGAPVVARHVYRKSGDALRLDVRIQKGEGTDSTTVVAADGGAWVKTDGRSVPRDTERSRDIVGRFAPDQLLRIALGVAADIETAAAWRELVVMGPEGDDLVVLHPVGGPAGGLVEVAFSRTDHRLRRVTMEDAGKTVVYSFSDYREIAPGLVVPQKSATRRDGTVVETIQVIGLDASTAIPASLFSPESN